MLVYILTAVTGSWTNETAPSAKYRHIIVTPLIANKSITTNMENELAESLSAYGIKAEKGVTYCRKNTLTQQ